MDYGLKLSDNKNLIFLASAKYLSVYASYIYDVGIVIYLFSNTQSVEVIGGFFVSQLLPAIIILFTGKIIDQNDKKKLLVVANLFKSFIFLLLLFSQNIWIIYLVTFLMNLILEFEGNTLSAFMVNAFSKERLFKVSSVINLLDSASLLTAPSIAAFIAMTFPIQANIIIDVLLFLLTSVFFLFIKTNSMVEQTQIEKFEKENSWKEILKNKNVIKTIAFKKF